MIAVLTWAYTHVEVWLISLAWFMHRRWQSPQGITVRAWCKQHPGLAVAIAGTATYAAFVVRPILAAVTVFRVGSPGNQTRFSLLEALLGAALAYLIYRLWTNSQTPKIPSAINGTATKVGEEATSNGQASKPSIRELVKAHDAAKDDQR